MGQYAWVIDVMLVLFILGTTYVISSEGLWGAALMFVNIMFAGLITFSVYEWLAKLIDTHLGFMSAFSDFVSIWLLFCVTFTLLRIATDSLGPTMVRFPGWLYHLGRFAFGLAASWYLWGMLLCMVETAPVHKMFLGYQWKTHAVWGFGIDRFWLGYVQSVTANQFDWSPARPFDADSTFIVRYHDRRAFGEPDPEMPGAKQPAAGAAPQGQAPGGQAPGR